MQCSNIRTMGKTQYTGQEWCFNNCCSAGKIFPKEIVFESCVIYFISSIFQLLASMSACYLVHKVKEAIKITKHRF